MKNQSFTLEDTKQTLKKAPLTISRPTKLSIFPREDGKSPVQTNSKSKGVGERKGGYSQPIGIDDPELQGAMMSKDPEERKEAYETLLNMLQEEDPELREEVEESLKEFEKTMMEMYLEKESEALQDGEILEEAETQ